MKTFGDIKIVGDWQGDLHQNVGWDGNGGIEIPMVWEVTSRLNQEFGGMYLLGEEDVLWDEYGKGYIGWGWGWFIFKFYI